MRPIDADTAMDRYYGEWEKQGIWNGDQDRDWLMRCIEEAPTLTLTEEIEQLKRERDAAISDIPHKCWSCGKGFHTENGFDCDEAHYRSGYKDCLSWRWRGQKEER